MIIASLCMTTLLLLGTGCRSTDEYAHDPLGRVTTVTNAPSATAAQPK